MRPKKRKYLPIRPLDINTAVHIDFDGTAGAFSPVRLHRAGRDLGGGGRSPGRGAEAGWRHSRPGAASPACPIRFRGVMRVAPSPRDDEVGANGTGHSGTGHSGAGVPARAGRPGTAAPPVCSPLIAVNRKPRKSSGPKSSSEQAMRGRGVRLWTTPPECGGFTRDSRGNRCCAQS